MNPFPRSRAASQQRGVASLVVVSVLLFIMLLVAAYANRSLISELKASANQYRQTQTEETAEAGGEWALAMLNLGRITADCHGSSAVTDITFRQKALAMDPTQSTTFSYKGVPSACIKQDSSWACSCPTTGNPVLPTPNTTGTAPVFQIQFGSSSSSTPSRQSIQIIVDACSIKDANTVCAAIPIPGEAYDRVSFEVALVPALATIPAASVTSMGTVDLSAGSLGVRNTDASIGGVTVNAAQVVPGDPTRLSTVAGASAGTSTIQDPALTGSARSNRLFASTFGMPQEAFKALPTVVKVTCANDCAADLSAADRKGTNMLWVDGDMTLSDVSIGTTASPVVLVVNGDIHITGTTQIQGLLWGRSLRWDGTGGLVRGAVVAQGDVGGTGAAEFIYDNATLTKLNLLTGTFVKVPGSWKDF